MSEEEELWACHSAPAPAIFTLPFEMEVIFSVTTHSFFMRESQFVGVFFTCNLSSRRGLVKIRRTKARTTNIKIWTRNEICKKERKIIRKEEIPNQIVVREKVEASATKHATETIIQIKYGFAIIKSSIALL